MTLSGYKIQSSAGVAVIVLWTTTFCLRCCFGIASMLEIACWVRARVLESMVGLVAEAAT